MEGFRSFLATVSFLSFNWFILVMITRMSLKNTKKMSKSRFAIFMYGFIRPFTLWIIINLIVLSLAGKTYIGQVITDICNTSTANVMAISGIGIIITTIIVRFLMRVVIMDETFGFNGNLR